MLSLNQLPQAVHLQENAASSPTRLSLLYLSSLFSHIASLLLCESTWLYSCTKVQSVHITYNIFYCGLIAKINKQNTFWKMFYGILNLHDTTIYSTIPSLENQLASYSNLIQFILLLLQGLKLVELLHRGS